MHHLKDDNGTLITDRVEISNTLGAAIEKSSSSNNYSKEFQSIKAQKEKQKINFKTNRNLRYTNPPKCCYFVVVGGFACLADPRGYASWSFDSW